VKYTADGANVSPPLAWAWVGVPPLTKEWAVVCDDPDAPGGTFTHWVLYGLAPQTTSLPEGLPRDKSLAAPVCLQGVNDFGKIGYSGPAPPPGKSHRYRFHLYALSAPTGLPPGAAEAQVVAAIEKSEITEATLVGLYGR
jgi:Raf kinase inhibitor-like YbhB/YbcL family protein